MKIIILTLVFMVSTVSFANIKVGYVDMQKAITQTKIGKKAFKKLKAFQKAKQKDLKKKEDEMAAERASIEKNFSVYSDEKKMKVQQEFQKKMMATEQYFRKSQAELKKKEVTLIEPVLKGLRDAITKYAEKEGYVMIFEKNGSALLFATKGSDLTSKVVKAYGK